ncbi:MAG TPA: acyclic terpene utilization AtuA family protein [Gemmatimonadaceae bacterium]|nr:acyclic terpene utilization AtuA family protein [Gemmatimonadaceae bacterium]
MSSAAGQNRIVRVAAGQGFWGDWLDAPRRQVEGGPVDYLMLDYLAEVTMSILQKQKERDPAMGYARDFIGAMESVLPAVVERGVRVIANAGGVNPVACAQAVLEVARQRGAAGKLHVGVVTGDDLLPRLDELIAGGHALANMETGEPLDVVRDRVLSANAYIGSVPIVEALARGANVVVTGRSTDTALTMAPLRHEFGWAPDDWDRLAAGIIAGHIIECGAQCSGGNCLYDWRNIPDLANVGYPIVEARADGSFVVTKHPGTGGRINVPSVTEQLVYEMGDPHSYITPDVVADFTSIKLAPDGDDRVRVFGIAGRPATDKLKVSIAYRAGFKAVGSLVYAWPDALEKATLADRVLRERLDAMGLRFDQLLTEFVGVSAAHGPLSVSTGEAPEVQWRVGVRSSDRKAVERFTREIAPLVLNGPPTVTGFAGGRPKVEEIVAYWPALVDKSVVQTKVEIVA